MQTSCMFHPCLQNIKAQAETMSWLMWQMGGLGPMQGQASHFLRFAKEPIPYAINRYQNEGERLYQVMETALDGKEWLANDEYSIADMAAFPWVFASSIAGSPYIFSLARHSSCLGKTAELTVFDMGHFSPTASKATRLMQS